jgi:hypothetical protein
MARKKAILAYLDDLERELLEQIAAQWGCSLSAAIKRLIRERGSVLNNPDSGDV